MYRTLRFPGFKIKAVTLSYDDCVIFDRKLIDILDENGIKCTFNINTGLFAKEKGADRRLMEDEAIELYKNSPHEVAVHGYKHLRLTEIDSANVSLEVIKDREILENIFDRIVKGMAYAYGLYDDRVVEVLKNCGINYARTTVSTGDFNIPTDWLRLPATCRHCDEKLMEYVQRFLTFNDENTAMPKLFYLWGHSYEFNDNNNWEIIEEFAKEIGNRDDIWYATNGEIYDYVKAYDSLIYSSNSNIIKNPTSIDVYLNIHGKKVLVKAGETVRL